MELAARYPPGYPRRCVLGDEEHRHGSAGNEHPRGSHPVKSLIASPSTREKEVGTADGAVDLRHRTRHASAARVERVRVNMIGLVLQRRVWQLSTLNAACNPVARPTQRRLFGVAACPATRGSDHFLMPTDRARRRSGSRGRPFPLRRRIAGEEESPGETVQVCQPGMTCARYSDVAAIGMPHLA